MHRDHQHRRLRARYAQVLDQFQPALAGQPDVDKHQRRFGPQHAVEGRARAVGLPADLQVPFTVHQVGQAVPEDRVIIDDEESSPRRLDALSHLPCHKPVRSLTVVPTI